jgi:hypothetical protein
MQRQLAPGQSSILPVYMGATASLIQEIFMQVVNFSHYSYLAALWSHIHMLAEWLTQPGPSEPLVPPANAPLAHQRLTLPFGSTGGSHRRQNTVPVSSFKSAAFEGKGRTMFTLKVVRAPDAAVGPRCAGRMTISGRMADVCAELDRMTQRESAL